jgi:hypothetical protein
MDRRLAEGKPIRETFRKRTREAAESQGPNNLECHSVTARPPRSCETQVENKSFRGESSGFENRNSGVRAPPPESPPVLSSPAAEHRLTDRPFPQSNLSTPPGVVRFKLRTEDFPRNTLVLKTGTESVAHRRRSLPRF